MIQTSFSLVRSYSKLSSLLCEYFFHLSSSASLPAGSILFLSRLKVHSACLELQIGFGNVDEESDSVVNERSLANRPQLSQIPEGTLV